MLCELLAQLSEGQTVGSCTIRHDEYDVNEDGGEAAGGVCNWRGSLTPGSEPGLMDQGMGMWTDKDKTWGNGQGKDMALRRNNC